MRFTLAIWQMLFRPLWVDERGQDSFESLLVAGLVVVAVVGILLTAFALFLPQIVGLACPSVDTAASPAATAGSCLVP